MSESVLKLDTVQTSEVRRSRRNPWRERNLRLASNLSGNVIRCWVSGLPAVPPLQNRFGDPRRADADVPRRIRQGQPKLRHEVDRRLGPHGRDPVPPAPPLEFRHADLRPPILIQRERRKALPGLSNPGISSACLLVPPGTI